MPDMTVLGDGGRGLPTTSVTPPALPPRPQSTGYSSGYGGYGMSMGYGSGYGSMYGSGMYGSGMYGSSMYGSGYGSYGGMYGMGGMYGGGYGAMNRFGADQQGGYNNNGFARFAEENSRQAFQSVESVVHAFGSVAMMLESTFYAVFNSFRAVIGVADQMSRVKAHFAQIFSALAVIKTLRWFYRKLLVFLRLRKSGLPEDAWSQATAEGMQALLAEQEVKGGKKSSWPIMIFFAVVMGGPWLIWKLLSSMYSNAHVNEWMDGSDDHFLAVAEYDFSAQRQEELSFRRGQKIVIAPKEIQPQIRGWLLACVDGKKQGLVPANYMKILGKRKGLKRSKTDASTSVPVPTNAGPLPAPGQGAIPPAFDQAFNPSQQLPNSTSRADFDSLYSGSNTPSLANGLNGQSIGEQHQTAQEVLDDVKNVSFSTGGNDK